MRRIGFLLVLLSTVVISLFGCGAGDSDHNRAWTVMIYLDGDNNLASAAVADMEEIRRATLDSSVEIVLQVDLRAPYNPATTQRYRVANGAFEPLENLGEADMASPSTLTNFVRWAGQTYPAERTALILWNHGNGWDQGDHPRAKLGSRSILYDDDNGSGFLANADVRIAIEKAGVKLDVLGIDASIMGTLEAQYEFRNLAPVLITSQEVGHDSGWDYTALISGLAAGTSAESFSRRVVSSYRDFFEKTFYPSHPGYERRHSITALRTACLSGAGEEVDRVAQTLLSALAAPSTRQSTLDGVTVALAAAQHLDYYVQPSVYVDLVDLLPRIDPTSTISQIVADCTFDEYHGLARPNSHGMSIVFFDPVRAKTFGTFDANYRNWDEQTHTGNRGAFINEFHWDEMMMQYVQAIAP